VHADAARRADGVVQRLAVARRIEEQRLVEHAGQLLEQLEGEQMAVELADRLGLDVAQGARAVEQLDPLELEQAETKVAAAEAELVEQDDVLAGPLIQFAPEVGTELGAFLGEHAADPQQRGDLFYCAVPVGQVKRVWPALLPHSISREEVS